MIRQPIGTRLVAPLLAALVVTVALAPPLLDAEENSHQTHVESEHDPATCAVLHDHTACSQLAKWFGGLSWTRNLLHRPDDEARARLTPRTAVRPPDRRALVPSPRGPPLRLS